MVKEKLNPEGFTLLEILMVISLIGVLAAVGVSQYVNFGKEAKTAVTQEKLVAIKIAIDGDGRMVSSGIPTKPGFAVNCLALPATLTDLLTQPGSGACASVYDPYTKQGWRGPYVSNTDPQWDIDGWGNAIQYNSATRTLKSCGADGSCGDSDDVELSF